MNYLSSVTRCLTPALVFFACSIRPAMADDCPGPPPCLYDVGEGPVSNTNVFSANAVGYVKHGRILDNGLDLIDTERAPLNLTRPFILDLANTQRSAVVALPEPGTAALLGVGLATLGTIQRRRHQASSCLSQTTGPG